MEAANGGRIRVRSCSSSKHVQGIGASRGPLIFHHHTLRPPRGRHGQPVLQPSLTAAAWFVLSPSCRRPSCPASLSATPQIRISSSHPVSHVFSGDRTEVETFSFFSAKTPPELGSPGSPQRTLFRIPIAKPVLPTLSACVPVHHHPQDLPSHALSDRLALRSQNNHSFHFIPSFLKIQKLENQNRVGWVSINPTIVSLVKLYGFKIIFLSIILFLLLQKG